MKKMLKKIYIWFITTIIKCSDAIISIFNRNHVANILLYVCMALESKAVYPSYQIRPKNTAEIPILTGLNQSKSFAIIMQGPICTKDEMTLNTIYFYKKAYPYAKIIVSTWNDEAGENIAKLSSLGAIIVQSEKPSNSGFMNVNYQMVSSFAGIKKAQELGYEFSVKTRTDQRICKPYIFDTMISAIKLFPGNGKQKGRIVILGVCGGGMFIPFHTCDFLYLGYTEDLIKIFSAPLDQRTNDENQRKSIGVLTRRQLSEQMLPPEIYILKHYCNDVLEYCCKDTIESYWNVVKNYLICFGMKDVDLMWNKYDKLFDLNFYTSSYFDQTDSYKRLSTMCFDFFNWLNLYMGNIEYDKCYEQYADVELFGGYESKKNY